jgi:hypothetical protein
MQLGADTEQEAQFFETEVGVAQWALTRLAVRRFDQALEDVERRRLHAVAEQELLAARQLVERRDQPDDEAEHRFERRSRSARRVAGLARFFTWQRSGHRGAGKR